MPREYTAHLLSSLKFEGHQALKDLVLTQDLFSNPIIDSTHYFLILCLYKHANVLKLYKLLLNYTESHAKLQESWQY